MTGVFERLDAIEARKDAATKGPWDAQLAAYAEFIDNVEADITYLLDLARKQQAALDAVLGWCDTNQYPHHPSEGVEGVFSSQDWALDDAARRVRTAITKALEGK